jgi:hypothetical protein
MKPVVAAPVAEQEVTARAQQAEGLRKKLAE